MTEHQRARDLLAHLRSRGARLWEEGGKLNYRAPQGAVSADELAALKAHKTQILALLEEEQQRNVLRPREEERFQPFPLSPVQGAYLVGRNAAFGYGGVACHVYLEVGYSPLDAGRVRAAWNRLVARHDMLRAVFDSAGSQRVLPEVPELEIPVIDADAAGADALLDVTREAMGHRIYQPERWPLFSLSLSQLPDRSVLHLSMDFLIADWASIWLLLGEAETLYRRPDAALPALEIQYRDYLLAERGLEESPAAQRDREWWQQRLPTLPPAPQLPQLDADPGAPVRFSRRFLQLSSARWLLLRQRAQQQGITPTAAVLAAYASVLERWSTRAHFCLNLTVLNRQPLHPQVNLLVGDFTTVSLLEVDFGEGKSWAQRAAAVSRQLYDDLDHRRCSGVEVMRELARARGRDEALMPYVFTSAIGLVPGEGEGALEGRLDGRGITQTPQVFIDCQAMDSANGLQINWDVRDGVFPPGVVDDLFAAFTQLIESMAADDGFWPSAADVPLPVWQQACREAVNATAAPLPEGGLHLPFFELARRRPDALAVADAARRLSYGELADAALALAGRLRASGVAPGDRVAIVLEKGVLQALAVLGAMAAGAAWVPVDVSQPLLRRKQIFSDAGVVKVLTQRAVEDIPPALRIDLDAADDALPLAEAHRPGSDDPAYIIYTSGSTGQPKGVVMGHRAVRNTVEDINRRFGVGPDDRVLALAQLGFDLAVYDLFGLLGAGGAVIYPRAERATDPSHWADCISAQRVTLWNSVPALMQMLESWLESEPGQTLDSLRLALLSGDWIPPGLPVALEKRLPQLALVALGGATEAAIWSNFYRWQGLDPRCRSVPYGTPLANQSFRVRDARGRDCPAWVPGELLIGGAGLAQGYLNDAEKTAAQFIRDARSGERLYRTGDRARYLPDGVLEFLGRADNQLKINGHRIEPGEIEAALVEMAEVDSACVVPRGEGSRRQLLALVTGSRREARGPDYRAAESAIADATRHLTARVTAAQLHGAMQALDGAVLQAMEEALARYDLRNGIAGTPILPRFGWLVRRWQALLAGARPPRRFTWDNVAVLWQPLLEGPAFLDYIRSSLDSLPDLLEGRVEAQNLLFPEGALTYVRALYRENLMASYLNEAVSALVAGLAGSARALRILEIGAGSGGTTESLIPALAGRRVEYHFTDAAAFFLPEARARYGHLPGMRFDLLNIDEDIRAQGFLPESYDVVLAAGVLENARDQRRALENIRLLTAPQGWVVLTEPTRECPWIMASQAFMMTPPEDAARREESYLDVAGWQALLAEVNDAPVLTAPPPASPLAQQGFHLLAQQIKRDRAPLFADALLAELGARLPPWMIPAQIQAVPALPLTANGKIDRKTAAGWWVEAADGGADRPSETAEGDPLEQLLSAQWAEALGIARVGLDQDVYDLGADSLIMARIAGKLRQILAAEPWSMGDIPFDTLLRHLLNGPTVRALALALRERPAAAVSDVPLPDADAPASVGRVAGSNGILLPFGGGDAGPLRVVFHAGLGTMDCFRPLLAELDAQQRGPVLGIVIADTAEYCALEPARAVEQMADDYARRLLATGHRRFQLIGYCLGGLFAVEVARRLSEQGAAIDDLVLISSHPVLFEVQDDLMVESLFIPNLHITLAQAGFGEVDGDALVRGFMQVLGQHQGRVPPGALAQLPGEAGDFFRQLQAVPIEARFASYVAGIAAHAGQEMPAEMALGLFRVFRQSFHAARFTPDPWVGDIRFLLPSEGSGFAPGMDDSTLNFWRDLCLGEVQVTPIAGNHFSCIETHNAGAVARRVAEGLQ